MEASGHFTLPPELVLFISVVIIISCLILTVIIITWLFCSRQYDQYIHKKTETIKAKFDLLLTGIIFIDEEEMETRIWKDKKEKLVKHFREHYLEKSLNRKILSQQILRLHLNFSGSSADILRNLYIDFGFHKMAMKQLRRWNWSLKAEAIRELTQMKMTDSLPVVQRLMKHRHKVVRLEAARAILSLNVVDPFFFFNKKKLTLSEWEMANLEVLIKSLPKEQYPQFAQWFGSKSESLICFSIRMMLQLNQFDGVGPLKQLLSHPSPEVRKEAIVGLGMFEEESVVDELIQMFEPANAHIRREILAALGKIGTEQALLFIKDNLNSPDFDIAFRSAVQLKSSGAMGLEMLKELYSEEDTIQSRVVRHALDSRI